MNEMLKAVAAALAGAAAMYYLDPQAGRRRRALVRDQFVSFAHDTGDFARAHAHDVSNRARGLAAGARTGLRFRRSDAGPPSDRTLHDRVRAAIGRAVSHPKAIDAEVQDGHVRLGGDILAAEVDAALAAVRAVPGVGAVTNELMLHEEAGHIPSLQGTPRQARNGSLRRLGPVLVAVAAPVALMAAASLRPAPRRRWTGRAADSMARLARSVRGESRAQRARRRVSELLHI
jgi:hypothetical protein